MSEVLNNKEHKCPVNFRKDLYVIGVVEALDTPFTCRGCQQYCTLQLETVQRGALDWSDLIVAVYKGGFRDVQFRTISENQAKLNPPLPTRQQSVSPRGPFPGDYLRR